MRSFRNFRVKRSKRRINNRRVKSKRSFTNILSMRNSRRVRRVSSATSSGGFNSLARNLDRKKIIIMASAVFVFLIAFLFYNLPDSPESRVEKVAKLIELYEPAEAKTKITEYISNYNEKERLDIFSRLPFKVVKDNREWLVDLMNSTLPSWKQANCFNARYLLTEAELKEKQNMRVIKNLLPYQKEIVFNDLISFVKEIYSISKSTWKIDNENFYVVDNSLKAFINVDENGMKIEKFSIRLFDIQDSYLFDLEYDKDTLNITPSTDKFKDNGAFEFSEKLDFYEIERIVEYLKEAHDFDYFKYTVDISDSLINEPSNNKASVRYFNIIYNRSNVDILDNISNGRYVGSMIIKNKTIRKVSNEEKTDDGKSKEVVVKEIPVGGEVYINLFKKI